MADKEKPEELEEESKPKGGKMKKIIMILLVVLVVGGGGAAGGFFAAGAMGGDAEGEEVDPDAPMLVLKDGTTVADTRKSSKKDAKAKATPTSEYKVSYHQIEQPFTSNLRNSSSFAQVSLAISTYYDERVVENIQAHEIAIRSAVLMLLAEQDRNELETQMGKQILQQKLTDRINQVLQEKAGFGGVEDAYFTNFVVQ